MARGKKKENALTPEEKLAQALVPDWECPYRIPKNWQWVVLKSCCMDSFSGKSPKYSKEPTDIKIIGQQANRREGIDLSYVKFGTVDFAEAQEEKMWLQKNDVLLNTLGSGTIGRSGIYKGNERLLTDGHLFVFRSNECYLPDLMYYYLCANEEQIIKSANGSTNQKFLSLSTFSLFPLPVPPVPEQQRIVDRIEYLFAKLDEAKEKAQSVLDSFETRKAAILHKAFTGELTAKWRAEHNLANTMCSIPLGKLILEGPQNGLYKAKSAYGEGTKILRIDGFYDGYLEPWDTLKRLQISTDELRLYGLGIGDIVINRVNSMAYLGKSALIRDLPEECVFESNMMRIVLDRSNALPEYVIKYLNSPIGLQELRKNAKQAVNQASINQQDVKNAEVLLPPIVEQVEIVRIIDSLFDKEQQAKESAEAVLEKIDLLKKSILARAFRGELGTNDPTEESALELLKQVLQEDTPAVTRKRSKSIPKELQAKLFTELERKIVKLYFKQEPDSLPAEELLSVSSKKFEVMETLRDLEKRKLIKKLPNGNYRLLE